MKDIIRYVISIIAIIVILRVAVSVLGGLLGSLSGVVILALVAWFVYRLATRKRS